MRVISLNSITRSVLSQKKKPIHYFYPFLKWHSDCLRELFFDTLQITNTVRLPLNEFNEAEIPADCVDWCGVGVQAGQWVRPLVQKNTLNRMENIDTSTGNQIVYPELSNGGGETGFGFPILWWGLNTNTNGENTGGYFGIGAGSEPDTFTIVEERNVIKINQRIAEDFIVFQYVSDGSFANAATTIPMYAQKTIEAYSDWQFKENSKSYGAGDAQLAKRYFDRQHEILRARKDGLTPELLIRIINRHRKASIQ
jgi:hypothetical protein